MGAFIPWSLCLRGKFVRNLASRYGMESCREDGLQLEYFSLRLIGHRTVAPYSTFLLDLESTS